MKIAIPFAKKMFQLHQELQLLPITIPASIVELLMLKFKKIQGSGNMTLIISIEEMNDMIKIIQALKNSNILIKGVTKTIKNETKEQKGGFLSMVLGTLGASLLGIYYEEKELQELAMVIFQKKEKEL